MELKPGYKKTEIGVIPEDWEVFRLRDCFIISAGGDIDRSRSSAVQDSRFRFPVYANAITNRGLYGFADYAESPANSVTITARGYLGHAEFRDHPFTAIVRLLVLVPTGSALPSYVSSYINERVTFAIESTGVPQLTAPQVGRYSVALPPLTEQKAIAEALSDVDASIAALSRLIAKKRDLRQGAMQRLLTGQTRLPGFTAPWVERRLGELGDIRSGGTPSTADPAFWDGGIPWCTPTDITALSGSKTLQATARTISARGLSASSAEVIPPRSLIMTSRATIGACAINLVPMTTNQGFKNIVPNTETDVDFLYYLMGAQTARLVALCGGSTFPEIGKKQLSAFEVVLPDNKVEQTAIAAVLSDMDAEIAAFDARLEKTRALKQAMMQALLTGRVRLPVRRDAAPQTKEAAHA